MKKSFRRGKRRAGKRTGKKTVKAVKQLVRIEKGKSPYTVINNSRPSVFKVQRALVGQSTGLIPTTTSYTLTTGSLFTQPGTGLNGSFSTCVAFQADEVPSWSEFSALFQQYRITKIEFTVRMTNGVANSQVMPILYIWKNLQPSLITSDVTLATADQCYKVIRYQFSAVDRECKFAIVPYYLESTPTGNTGTTYPASMRKKGWLDTSFGNINYYGIAYSFDNLVGSDQDTLSFEVDYVYHLQFRGTK